MYLRKYQVGGIAYTPYLPTQSASPQESVTTSSGDTTSSNKPEKISGTIKKEIIDILKENGIHSDVSKFLSEANAFLSKSANLSGMSLFGGTDDDYDLSDLIKIQQLANDVKQNKEMLNDAQKQIVKEAAGSEAAITGEGRMYVQTEDGTLKTITPTEYNENPDKYNVITNNRLRWLRENSEGLAFRDDILHDLENVIGMESIVKYVQATVNSFGSDERGGYTTKDKSVANGMKQLIENGPDGYYKATTKDERRDMNAALKYLWNSLPSNAKHTLIAKTAAEGGDPKRPEELLFQIYYQHTDTSIKTDFDESATKYDPDLAGRKGGSGSESQTHDEYGERLTTGNGLDPERWINIMPSNTGVTLHAYAQNAGAVLKDKNRLNTTNLQVVLTQGDAIGAIVDPQSITFGDQLLNPSDFTNVMYDSSTNMKRVWLPIKYNSDGRITPNFEAQQNLEKIQTYIADQNGQVSDVWIQNWLQENLPEARWNPERKQVEFNKEFTRPFLVLHGIAAKNRVSINTDTPYLSHLSNQEGKQWMDDYDRIVTEETVSGKLEHNKAKGAARWKYYSGNIYLPISGPTVGAFVFNNQYFPKSTYTDITQKARASEIKQEMKLNF